MHWGDLPVVKYNGEEYKNLYAIVTFAFQQEWLVALYVISMIFLGFHLSHGFASAFQTLGLNHVKYSPAIKKVGLAFSIIVPALFASMPLYIYFMN
jgi:succinate dehydrogenase / fumarate reductase cytochrome b subunit